MFTDFSHLCHFWMVVQKKSDHFSKFNPKLRRESQEVPIKGYFKIDAEGIVNLRLNMERTTMSGNFLSAFAQVWNCLSLTHVVQ